VRFHLVTALTLGAPRSGTYSIRRPNDAPPDVISSGCFDAQASQAYLVVLRNDSLRDRPEQNQGVFCAMLAGVNYLDRRALPVRDSLSQPLSVCSGMFSSAATSSSVRDPRCLALLSACSLNSGVLLNFCMCICRSDAGHPLGNGDDNYSDAGGIRPKDKDGSVGVTGSARNHQKGRVRAEGAQSRFFEQLKPMPVMMSLVQNSSLTERDYSGPIERDLDEFPGICKSFSPDSG
jgi:hypothetical protein